MTSRRVVLRGAAALAGATIGFYARAQAYPAKPIQFYVAFGPGGAGDIVARMVAKKLGESMGQPVIVENRPAPMIAAVTVAKSKPDGYTMFMCGSGTALTQVLFKSVPYDIVNDFTQVSTLANFDLVMLTAEGSEFRTVQEVIAFAKANPGKLNIGSVRIGSTQHLAAEMFKSMAGIDAVLVPYRTTGDIVTALRSKDLHVAVEILPPVLSQISGKVIRPLAMMSRARFPGLPDVPTIAEGAIPGFEASSWNGLAVPASTPREVVAKLAAEVQKAMAAPDVQKELIALGMAPRSSTPAEMHERMKSDVAKWKGVIERSKIPLQ